MSAKSGPSIVTEGLVFYLDFSNKKSYSGAGTNCYDLKNDVTGILTNGPTFDTNKYGSLVFDGVNDYINVGSSSNSSNLSFGTGAFTVEAWVNFNALPTSNTYKGIINTMTSTASAGTDSWWFALYNAAGTTRLQLGRHGNGIVYAYTVWTPTVGIWYHLLATKDSGNNIYIYIDGISKSVTKSDWSVANFTRTGPLGIGVIATPFYLNGKIGQVKLYKGKSFSFSDVQKNYSATRSKYE